MYRVMSSLTWLLASIFLILIAFVTAQTQCINEGNYTSESTYSSNLNTLLSALPSNVDSTGFYNASAGLSVDRVYATVLCRADLQLDTCRTCIQNATIELLQGCPNQKRAILWRETCMLRYSNESMFGIQVNFPAYFWWNPQNSTDTDQFNEDLRTLLDNLRDKAASGGSLRKVAAANANRITSYSQTIFAIQQCTPDLSHDDCVNCLTWASTSISRYCDGKIGCRVLMPSCNLRYENYSFFDMTRLQELQVVVEPGPPTPSTPPPDSPLEYHTCLNDGNYTSNSTYEDNLIKLLFLLPLSVHKNGFSDTSWGQNLDRAWASVFCRGDVELNVCRDCIQAATIELLQVCPNQKKAVMWKELCTLRYSNVSMLEVLAINPEEYLFIRQNVQVPNQDKEDLMMLLNELVDQAAIYSNPWRKVAARNTTTSDSVTIYALVQCSPDLNPSDCRSCLIGASDKLTEDCVQYIGCRALRPSCNLWFETRPFYNEKSLQEFLHEVPNSMPSVSSPPPGNSFTIGPSYPTAYPTDPKKRSNLNWETRHKIIGGVAKGLLYLHEDSRLRIVHRNLKPSTVLLDEEMNPKIADFGMARLFVKNETQGNTSRIVGTYMATWHRNTLCTVSSLLNQTCTASLC